MKVKKAYFFKKIDCYQSNSDEKGYDDIEDQEKIKI